jgi:hypothetical protein
MCGAGGTCGWVGGWRVVNSTDGPQMDLCIILHDFLAGITLLLWSLFVTHLPHCFSWLLEMIDN